MKRLLVPLTDEERRRRDLESVWEDARPWIGASMVEHAEGLAQVLEVSHALTRASPFRDRILADEDRRSPESEKLWIDLVRRYQR